MTYYDLGQISSEITSRDDYSVTQSDPQDVFEFDLFNSGQQINLNLHDMNGDADLYLYFDSNNNGFLDGNDTLVAASIRSGSQNDVIDYSTTSSGTYFAQVVNFSGGSIQYDLDFSATYDLGSLSNSPVSRTSYHLNATDPKDVFEFDISGNRTIHLNLNNISSGDDADLRLYRDNGNGIFDSHDTIVASSSNSGHQDDLIDYYATAGTYFVEVARYANGSNGAVNYDLDLSATTNRESNLVGGEITLGTISSDLHRSGSLNNSNTVDSYAFSLGFYGGVNISLSGLSADADIRLIEDTNNNGIVDSGEVIGSSTQAGTSSESINGIDFSGNYILQVYQYSSTATNYSLSLDYFSTPFA